MMMLCPKCGPVRPLENPRLAHLCPRCRHAGLREMPGGRPRNLDFERDVTREAARGSVDPSPLIEYAEARADRYPVRELRPGVDWLREAREEAADMRNYLCWWLQDNLGDPRQMRVMSALQLLVIAYDQIRPGDDD